MMDSDLASLKMLDSLRSGHKINILRRSGLQLVAFIEWFCRIKLSDDTSYENDCFIN